MGDHWKSLANKLGAPGMDAPVSEPAPAPETPKPAPRPAAPVHTEPPRATRAPEVEPAAPVAPPVEPPPAPEPPADAGRKGKRKSSWDTLTSFFGISSPEPAPEVSSAAPAETDALPEPAKPARPAARQTERPARPTPAAPKGTALDELFGDAPRQELSWDKPAPRIIDDVSDWDDEPVVDAPTLDDQADTFTPPGEAGDETEREPTRRRRRRRRGGRRDEVRGEARREQTDSDRPVRSSPRADTPVDDEVEAWEVELDPIAAEDDWVEPSSFESVSDVDIDADVDPDAPLPQRRSNRRRRRGRGRSERAEGSLPPAEASSEVREPRPPREAREPREVREPRDVRETREPREAREPRESSRTARPPRESRALEDEMEVEARPERTRREPRTPREGRQRPPREARREPIAAVDDLDNQVDSSLAAELEDDGTGTNRHPKIPTWADSLEAIISANMENHSRSDHRGGSRGRPRGNGGPPRRP